MRFLVKAISLKLPVVLAAVATSHIAAFAASDDLGKTVSTQVLKCLKLPAGAPKDYGLSAVVVLKEGSADFVSVNFRAPPSAWEMTAAPALGEAITECEPYGSASGTVEITITPELVEAGAKN
jgi:hypothetical protein